MFMGVDRVNGNLLALRDMWRGRHQIFLVDAKPALSAVMINNTRRQYDYNMHSQKVLIEAVNKGYEYFWTRPDRPWRNKIYEANIFAGSIKNLNPSKIRESLSRQEEDLSEQSGGVRDMPMQPSNGFRPSPQSGEAWKQSK
jgi:hypothetical protein